MSKGKNHDWTVVSSLNTHRYAYQGARVDVDTLIITCGSCQCTIGVEADGFPGIMVFRSKKYPTCEDYLVYKIMTE